MEGGEVVFSVGMADMVKKSVPFFEPISESGWDVSPALISHFSPLSIEFYPQSKYFTVRGQYYFSRLLKYWPPIPLSPASLSFPRNKGGGTHSPGERGMGGQYFGKREK